MRTTDDSAVQPDHRRRGGRVVRRHLRPDELILNGPFILWRLGMYLLFALFVGLLLKLRPSLLPYFAVIHALIDVSAWSVYFMV